MVLVAMGTLRCLEILTSRHIAVKHGIWTQQNVRDLLIVCTCFQVCERYEVVPCREVGMVLRFVSSTLQSLSIKYMNLINIYVQPAASSPSVSQVSEWARLRPRIDAW